MRHPSIEPSTPSHQSLNPKLQRALSCLDTRLEAELTRYRRQRFGRSISPSSSFNLKQPAKVELAAISERASQATSPADAAPTTSPLSGVAIGAMAAEPASVSSSYLALVSQLPKSEIDASEAEADTGNISAPQSQESTHNLATNSAPPDDYLESSEELLRNLAREEAQVQVERSFIESLATPLGVVSMLMLLLSSAMFGYAIMNPSSLGIVAGLFNRPQSAPTASPTAAPANPDASIPNSPPLDKQEFVDLGLNDLTTLNSRRAKGLPTPAKPSPSVAASPASPVQSNADAASPTALDRATTTAPVQSAPPARSAAPRNDAPVRSYAPAPARSYAPPAPIRSYSPPVRSYSPMPPALPPVSVPRTYSPPVQSAPAAGGGYSYKVQIPYTGDQSLEDARKVAPDAYLRPDGNIQLGAMGSEAEAKAKAQELQTQGIQAEVRQR